MRHVQEAGELSSYDWARNIPPAPFLVQNVESVMGSSERSRFGWGGIDPEILVYAQPSITLTVGIMSRHLRRLMHRASEFTGEVRHLSVFKKKR